MKRLAKFTPYVFTALLVFMAVMRVWGDDIKSAFGKGPAKVQVAAPAAPSAEADRQAIYKALKASTDGWNAGSLEKFMELYAPGDSLLFWGNRGATYGYANVLAMYKKNFPDTASRGHLSYQIERIDILGPEGAYVAARFKVRRTKGDASGPFMLAFRKINGKWLCVADYTG